jgi:hypothetical protein
LVLLGVALLAVAGVAYLLGYRGGLHRQAETTVATTTVPPTTVSPTTTQAPVGFALTSAGAADVSSYASSIAWTTSEPSTGRLRWGPVGFEPVLWDSAEASGTQHVVRLTGLASSTTYHVSLVATSADQHIVRANLSFTTAAAPTQVQGGVRDGVLLVNGEPFFPLIAWQQCPEVWPVSLAAGINLFAAGSPCASPAGALSGLAGRALVAGADSSLATSETGFLGWFYPDEADARGLTGASLPPLPAGVRFLTITSHFASAAAPLPSGRGMYPGLVAAADVVGFDVYPLQELCQRALLPLDFDAQQQLEALAPGKPTFQWIESRGMRCGTSPGVALSPGTIRAESWLALAAGAHGLAFFPPDWDDFAAPAITGIAARIRQLEPALFQPVQPVHVEAAPGVRAAARSYHGAVYVIAVNADPKASDVRLTVPGLGNRTLLVLGTPTTVKARRDVFTDRLKPLDVRIYVAPPPS